MMRCLQVCTVIVAIVATNAMAQLGNLCVNALDHAGTDCYVFEELAPSTTEAGFSVLHTNHAGAKGIQFAAPIPFCHSGETVTTDIPWPIQVGDIETGIFIGYGQCAASPVIVATRSWTPLSASSLQCCEWISQADPSTTSQTVEGLGCDDVVVTNLPAHQGTVVVANPDEWDPVVTCGPCTLYFPYSCDGPVPVEIKTWGAIKALYGDR